MTTAQLVFSGANPATGKFETGYPIIAAYKFNSGATYAQVKNGFSWQGAKTIGAPAGETEQGGLFSFSGSADPRYQPVVEQRYSFSEMSEFWIKKRFFVPSNYFHRRCIILTVTGDMTSWQLGDSLLANNGIDTGFVEYVDGQTLLVLFPTSWTESSKWNGLITNLTRSAAYPCVYGGIWGDNNKFHALWCDGYSQAGKSPSVVFELHERGNGGSSLYYHIAADGFGTGQNLPNATSPDVDFIRPIDVGKWFDWVCHVKMASSESAQDGVIEDWVRREGDSVYTKLHTQTNAPIGARAAATPPNCKFKAGYCHGAMNTSFRTATALCDSEIILSAKSIDGVV